jgi:hypothetical protein
MKSTDIAVILDTEGKVRLRNWRNNAFMSGTGRVDLTGLDGKVLRVFERWLTIRDDRTWSRDEIRVFGQLLHRLLFPGETWAWVERQRRGKELMRLMLAFPADAASSSMAALPWEYMCTQDRSGRDGEFLALLPTLALSRVVESGVLEQARAPKGQVKVLPVVGVFEDSKAGLGGVVYEEVLDVIEKTSSHGFVPLEPLLEATEKELTDAVKMHKPHIVHIVGHGRFRDGQGAVRLRAADGGAEWLPEDRLADALCSMDWVTPIVILHACEGGTNDFGTRFAGLAPAIARRGALCVVAMQYAVLNSSAIAFSTAVYNGLAQGGSLDTALQRAVVHLWDESKDPRLIGVPTIYQRSTMPLLGPKRG